MKESETPTAGEDFVQLFKPGDSVVAAKNIAVNFSFVGGFLAREGDELVVRGFYPQGRYTVSCLGSEGAPFVVRPDQIRSKIAVSEERSLRYYEGLYKDACQAVEIANRIKSEIENQVAAARLRHDRARLFGT